MSRNSDSFGSNGVHTHSPHSHYVPMSPGGGGLASIYCIINIISQQTLALQLQHLLQDDCAILSGFIFLPANFKPEQSSIRGSCYFLRVQETTTANVYHSQCTFATAFEPALSSTTLSRYLPTVAHENLIQILKVSSFYPSLIPIPLFWTWE